MFNGIYSVKEFRSALQDVLKSEEDLSRMYLYAPLRSVKDHEEAEIYLETSDKRGEVCE